MKPISSTALLIIVFLLADPQLGVAQFTSTQTASFDTDNSQNTDGYTAFVEVSPNVFAWQEAGGTEDPASGGLLATVTGSQTSRRSSTVRRIASSDSGAVAEWETALDFRFTDIQGLTDSRRVADVWLGFSANASNPSTSNDSSHQYLSSNSQAMAVRVTGEFNPSDANSQNSVRAVIVSGGSEQSTTQFFQNGVPAFANWLRLTAKMTLSSGSNYLVSYRLEDLGADGAQTPVLIQQSANFIFANSHLAAATTTYAAFAMATRTHTNVTTKAALHADNHRVTTVSDTPLAPAATAATVTLTTLSANWNAPVSGPPPQNYIVELTTQADHFDSNTFIGTDGSTGQVEGVQVSSSTLQLAFNGLTPGVPYVYRLLASNSVGVSAPSNVIISALSETNTPPTLNLIADQTGFPAGGKTRVVALTGISNGGDLGQEISVTALASNPAVVTDVQIAYSSPDSTGTLTLTSGEAGTSTVTVTVDDGEDSFQRLFQVTVLPAGLIIGFDDASDLSEFSLVNSTSTLTHDTAGGTGSPGGSGLRFTPNSTSEVRSGGWRTQTYDLASATSARTSILVKMNEITKEGELRIGFVADGGDTPNVSEKDWLKKKGTGHWITSLLKFKDAGAKLETMLSNKNSSSDGSESSKLEVTVATTLKNNWLRVSLDLTPASSTSFEAVMRIENLGLDGLAEPELIREVTSTLTNSPLRTATAARGAFVLLGKENAAATKMYLDDHEVIVDNSVPPEPPTALAAAPLGNTQFQANWQSASAPLGYVLEITPAATPFADGTFIAADGTPGQSAGISLGGNVTSSLITGLLAGADYVYRVFAVNSGGSSPASNVISVSTVPEGLNAPPFFNAIAEQARMLSNAPPRLIQLTGINAGLGESGQPLSFTVSSSDTSIIEQPVITYSSPDATAQLSYRSGAEQGTATITVTLDDGQPANNTFSRQFTVEVRQPPSVVEFDDASQFTPEFVVSGSGLSVQPDVGVGAPPGSALRMAATSSEVFANLWRQQPYDIRAATFLKTSVMVNFSQVTKEEVQVGIAFVNEPGGPKPSEKDWLKKKPTGQYLSGHFKYKRKDSQVEILIGNRSVTNDGDGSEVGKITFAHDSVIQNNWLRLTLTLIPESGSSFLTRFLIEDMGPDGMGPPAFYREVTERSLTNTPLRQSAETYAALNIFNKKTNSPFYLDNHEVIVSSEPPSAPETLPAERVTASSVLARWQPGEETNVLTGWILEVSAEADNFSPGTLIHADGTGSQAQGILISEAAAHAQRISGLNAETSYLYRLRALNQSLESDLSDVRNVTTREPGYNSPPTLDVLAPLTLLSGSGLRTVSLSGISDGGEGTQSVNVTVAQTNAALLSGLSVSYTSPSEVGTLTFTPIPGGTGTSEITVTVSDGLESLSRSFTVSVGITQTLVNAGNNTTGAEATGSVWKYLDNGSDQGTAWKEPGFDDTAWASGPSKLGYGQSGLATLLSFGPDANNKFIATYFRHAFQVPDPASVFGLTLRLKRNDGAVVYLNGQEVVRTNMPATGEITHTTFASGKASNDGDTWLDFPLDASLLVQGENLLAVSVHQDKLTSSDILLDAQLNAIVVQEPVTVTALPAVKVNSGGFAPRWSIPEEATATAFIVEVSTAAADFAPGSLIGVNGTGGQNEGILIVDGALREIQLSGLSAGTAYRFRVRSPGSALPSNVVGVTTLATGQNAPPTLDPLPSPLILGRDSGPRIVPVTGISDGGEGFQSLTLIVTSSNPSVIPIPAVNYFSPDTSGQITLTPAVGVTGTSVITVTVDDNAAKDNRTSRSFTVHVVEPGPHLAVRALPGGTGLTSGSVLAFPATLSGTSRSRQIELVNTGSEPLTGLDLQLTGTAFQTSALSTTTLQPGETAVLTVTFSPAETLPYTGALDVTSNALGGGFTLQLQGSGLDDVRTLRPITVPAEEQPPATITDEAWAPAFAGMYDGLLRDASAPERVIGALNHLTLTAPKPGSSGGGTASGTLHLLGLRLTLRGTFDAAGELRADVPVPGGGTAEVVLQTGSLNLTPAAGEAITGSVAWAGQSASVRLVKTAVFPKNSPAPAAGSYTMLLPSQPGVGDDMPGGDGWATVTVRATGVVSLKGMLGDGTTFTETAYVGQDGTFSLFAPLYTKSVGKGWIGGCLSLREVPDTSDFDGLLHWRKGAETKGPRYKDGFELQVWALGSRYAAPTGKERMLTSLENQEYNALVSLITPDAAEEKVVSWQMGNRIVHYGPQTLIATGTVRAGNVKGSFQDKPAGGPKLAFRGVVFQKQQRVGGLLLRAQDTGALRIVPGTNFPRPGSEGAGAPVSVADAGPAAADPAFAASAWQAGAAGVYQGVLRESGGGISGGLENFKISANRAFSATLWIQGARLSIKGTLNEDGTLTFDVPRKGGAAAVQVSLTLALTDGSSADYQITGSITADGVTHELSGLKRPLHTPSTPAPAAGAYTVALPAEPGVDPAVVPAGHGYGTLSVSPLGLCSGALVLADGTKSTFAGHLSATGHWDMYRSLSGGKAWVAGRVTFRDVPNVSDANGSWRWVKLPGASKTVYPNGFDMDMPVIACRYVRPVANTCALDLADSFHNAWLRLSGENLSSLPGVSITDYDAVLSWTAVNRLLYFGPDKVSCKVAIKTGLVTGSVSRASEGIRIKMAGVILQKQGIVAGYHFTRGAAAPFFIQPR